MLKIKIYYDLRRNTLLLGRDLYRTIRMLGKRECKPQNVTVFDNIEELNSFRGEQKLPLYKSTDLLTQEMHYSVIDYLKNKYY